MNEETAKRFFEALDALPSGDRVALKRAAGTMLGVLPVPAVLGSTLAGEPVVCGGMPALFVGCKHKRACPLGTGTLSTGIGGSNFGKCGASAGESVGPCMGT